MIRTSSHRYRRLQDSRVLPLIVLPFIVFLYILLVLRLHPSDLFGITQDDSIYFSSAKALSEGRGYILPSLPGAPPATKYPILYPLILSAVWKLNPSFPANITSAIYLNLAIGALFIWLCYLFCRRCLGLHPAHSLLVTAFCGLHGLTVFYSAILLSDILFAALVLAVFLFIERANAGNSRFFVFGAGVVAGMACLSRTAGIPLFAGVLLYFLFERSWKKALSFSIGLAPVLATNLLLLRSATANPPVAFSAEHPGWMQTWYYYTSYGKFRALDSPTLSLKFSVMLNQVLYLLAAIPRFLLSPLSDVSVIFWLSSTLLIAALAIAGTAGFCRHRSARPVCAALVCYAAVLLAWDFPAWDRFLLPFLPLFVTAIAWQALRWTQFLWRSAKENQDRLLRFVGAIWTFSLASLLLCTLFNFSRTSRVPLSDFSRERGELGRERLAAYEWIRAHTKPEDVIVANNDVVAFLYTDRQSITAIMPLPADLYNAGLLRNDMAHFWDTPHVLRAKYWLTDDDEQVGGLVGLRQPFLARIRESQTALPTVFKAPGRRAVQLRNLECVREPSSDACRAVAPVLFPAHYGPGQAVPGKRPVHNR